MKTDATAKHTKKITYMTRKYLIKCKAGILNRIWMLLRHTLHSSSLAVGWLHLILEITIFKHVNYFLHKIVIYIRIQLAALHSIISQPYFKFDILLNTAYSGNDTKTINYDQVSRINTSQATLSQNVFHLSRIRESVNAKRAVLVRILSCPVYGTT